MGFKVGDVVICIDDTQSGNDLVLNNHYIICKIINYNNVFRKDKVMLTDIPVVSFYADRFKLDKKYYRKEKIKQLRNGI